MMKENVDQLNMSSDEKIINCNKSKDSGILSEITNLKEEHGDQELKKGLNSVIKTQKSRKSISMKVVKLIETKVKKVVVPQKNDNCLLKNTNNKGKKHIQQPILTENEGGILDSTNVLQQLHKEINEFQTKYIGGTSMESVNSKCEGLNVVSKDFYN
ncbi:hypothetical protein Ddye_001778 [Dipteronia dyeriana]|uniref:Uncharacterized protein n=1 Tax=Dipteronia dyeriana TaxID=168575 RepID=A0AAE0CTV3_9ROSI|nr:hypothetical protein Ddye_001778 [Dipteronia dyeriana]